MWRDSPLKSSLVSHVDSFISFSLYITGHSRESSGLSSLHLLQATNGRAVTSDGNESTVRMKLCVAHFNLLEYATSYLAQVAT